MTEWHQNGPRQWCYNPHVVRVGYPTQHGGINCDPIQAKYSSDWSLSLSYTYLNYDHPDPHLTSLINNGSSWTQHPTIKEHTPHPKDDDVTHDSDNIQPQHEHLCHFTQPNYKCDTHKFVIAILVM